MKDLEAMLAKAKSEEASGRPSLKSRNISALSICVQQWPFKMTISCAYSIPCADVFSLLQAALNAALVL